MTITPSPDVEEGLGGPVAIHDDEEGYGADENQALLASTKGSEKHVHFSSSSSSSSDDDATIVDSPEKKTEGYQVGPKKMSGASYWARLVGAFAVGVLCTVIMHLIIAHCSTTTTSNESRVDAANQSDDVNELEVPPWVGSSTVHRFPPAEPTNKYPELFPSDVGHGGPTPTGAEAAIVATAPTWPMHTGAPQLVVPTKVDKSHHYPHEEEDSDSDDDDSDDSDDEEEEEERHKSHHRKGRKKRKFNMLEQWGNLSPWYSIERGGFGLDSGVEAPETCRVTGLHFLHRHGARYPTEDGAFFRYLHGWDSSSDSNVISVAKYGGPAKLAQRLHKTTQDWTGSGKLGFLNDWFVTLVI